jgi:hypothetical protein
MPTLTHPAIKNVSEVVSAATQVVAYAGVWPKKRTLADVLTALRAGVHYEPSSTEMDGTSFETHQ